MTGAWFIVSLDVGGSVDPAAIAVLQASKADRLIKAKLLHLAMKNPVVTPQGHIDLVQTTITNILAKYGPRIPVRYVIDISNNSAVAYLLATVLPRNSIVGVKITGSEAHGAGLQPFMIGDVGGRAMSIPVMNLSRRQLLLDIGSAFQTKQLTLPVDDPEQQKSMQVLKTQMARASLKTTPSGKQIAVVNRGHDDALLATARAWAATRLPAPRDPAAIGKREATAPDAGYPWA